MLAKYLFQFGSPPQCQNLTVWPFASAVTWSQVMFGQFASTVWVDVTWLATKIETHASTARAKLMFMVALIPVIPFWLGIGLLSETMGHCVQHIWRRSARVFSTSTP